jgi:hypothetical protein
MPPCPMGKAILVPPLKPPGKRPTKYSPPLVFMDIYFRQGTDPSMPFAIRGLLGNQLVVVSVLIAQQLGFAVDFPQSVIDGIPRGVREPLSASGWTRCAPRHREARPATCAPSSSRGRDRARVERPSKGHWGFPSPARAVFKAAVHHSRSWISVAAGASSS